MNSTLRTRIRRLRARLKQERCSAALLVTSNREVIRSRDSNYLFEQETDFYYLTRSLANNAALIVSTEESAPVLIVQKPTDFEILWEGAPESPRPLANSLGAELVDTKNVQKEILDRLAKVEKLFYQNTAGTLGYSIAKDLFARPSHRRFGIPSSFEHVENLIGELRLFKDSSEKKLIKQAIQRSKAALEASLPVIRAGNTESRIGDEISYQLALQDCGTSFPTIVASGKSAATLHYRPKSKRLSGSEMLMIDFGGRYKMYCADITRVFPISGRFSDIQYEVYTIVLEAERAAIGKVKNGVRIRSVYNAAAKVLCEGLVELGVLRGNPKRHFDKGTYRQYFPHSIGHSLGLDAHDAGPLRSKWDAKLKTGMVFTIEPGLYFPKKTGTIPASGIRIEDDILVTERGCEVLSKILPTDPEDVEEFLERSRSG